MRSAWARLRSAGYVGSRPRVRRAAVEAWVASGLSAAPVSTASRSTGPRRRRGSYPRVLGAALDGMGDAQRECASDRAPGRFGGLACALARGWAAGLVQLRVASAARGPLGDARRAPARARCAPCVDDVRPRDRRARRRAADAGRGRHSGGAEHRVCRWCVIGGRAWLIHGATSPADSVALQALRVSGRCAARTRDLLLVRQALLPAELTARGRD